MAVTDQARNQLFNRLREALGDEDAATMMELLPPVGWADVARQRDLDQLGASIDQRFDGLEARLDLRFDAVEQRFATRDDLRSQTYHFIGWMLTANATTAAIIGVLLTLR